MSRYHEAGRSIVVRRPGDEGYAEWAEPGSAKALFSP